MKRRNFLRGLGLSVVGLFPLLSARGEVSMTEGKRFLVRLKYLDVFPRTLCFTFSEGTIKTIETVESQLEESELIKRCEICAKNIQEIIDIIKLLKESEHYKCIYEAALKYGTIKDVQTGEIVRVRDFLPLREKIVHKSVFLSPRKSAYVDLWDRNLISAETMCKQFGIDYSKETQISAVKKINKAIGRE